MSRSQKILVALFTRLKRPARMDLVLGAKTSFLLVEFALGERCRESVASVIPCFPENLESRFGPQELLDRLRTKIIIV